MLTEQQTPIQRLKSMLDTSEAKETLAATLHGMGITPARFLRGALNLVNNDPKIMEKASIGSIYVCILRAAALGVELDPAVGHMIIATYSGVASLQKTYKGVIEFAYRTGKVSNITAGVIYETDVVEVVEGTGNVRSLTIRRGNGPRLDEKITDFYAACDLVGGAHDFLLWTRAEMEAFRSRFSKNREGWAAHFRQFGQKTMIIQLMKYKPSTVQVSDAHESYIDAEYEVVNQDALPSQREDPRAIVAPSPDMEVVRPAQQPRGTAHKLRSFVSQHA